MRQLIVTELISLDGVIDSPGGGTDYRHTGWTFTSVEFDPAAYEIKGREQDGAGPLLLGGTSYGLFAPVWPTMTTEFAGYNAMPRYVVSTTLEHDGERWPATILGSIDEVAALKQGEGAPLLVHGSATLVQSLLAAGLVDRLHLLVFPVLLGAGARLIPDADAEMVKLALVEHAVYSNGVQKQVFDVVR